MQPSLQDLLAEQDVINQKIEAVTLQRRAEGIAKVTSTMAEYGLTAGDFRPARKQLPAKYRDAKTGATWSGRGKRAKWLKDAIAAGKRIEDFAVA